MTVVGLKNAAGRQNTQGSETMENISLNSLAEETGFPVEFIKDELVLDGESVELDQLRSVMMDYLRSTMSVEQ